MHRTKLRRVGGSVMLAVPPALLETLELAPGQPVGLDVRGNELIVKRARARYALAELLEAGEADSPASADREWLDDGPLGREQI